MEGAVAEALKRLSPKTIESSGRPSPLTAMLPPLRKAALWDHYCEMHAALAKATSTDFHASLGDAFLAAYERKLDTLE